MAGHRKLDVPGARMSRERRARGRNATARAAKARRRGTTVAELSLAGLRQAQHVTQETLAARLATSQPEISKMEHRSDMYVSTLRHYVEALGGELEIIAHLPQGAVRINQFHDPTKSA